MKIAYFDCFSGISGDMTLGAFIDAGFSIKILKRELDKLNIKGYKIRSAKTRRGAIAGTKFECIRDVKVHSHRSLKEIISLIDKSSLNGNVKSMAKRIFETIGSAEAKAHGIAAGIDVRLHELGDVDSIVDIVGTAIAIDSLGIEEVYSSRINLGRTFVKTFHGRLPVPAPATIELLKGVPVSLSETEAELVTPTGAGILKAVSKGFGEERQMEVSGIGYGAGSKELVDRPNLLRVVIGETKEYFKQDTVFVIEANIDDMSPQNFEYVFERLFKEGALDVYLSSIIMKKSRPAFKLSVLANNADMERISSAIFKETTTIGVRFFEAGRYKLEREFVKAKTKYGSISVKVSRVPGGGMTLSPEYDECARIARSKNVPLRVVCDEAKRLAAK